jgi:hypothetical protein
MNVECRTMNGRAGRLGFSALVALAVLAGTVSGCPKKELRYPADHERFQRIDAAVEALRMAYVQKDLPTIQSLMLPSGKLDRVEQEIAKDFQTFEEITLELSIERIVINGEMIDVFVHWQGFWKRNEADAGVRERGHGVLRWMGEHSILLQSVEGDMPFGMASRKTEPTPKPSGSS